MGNRNQGYNPGAIMIKKEGRGGCLVESLKSIEQSTLVLCSIHPTWSAMISATISAHCLPSGKQPPWVDRNTGKEMMPINWKGRFPSHSWVFFFTFRQTKPTIRAPNSSVLTDVYVCQCSVCAGRQFVSHMEMSQSNHKQLSSPALRSSVKGTFT